MFFIGSCRCLSPFINRCSHVYWPIPISVCIYTYICKEELGYIYIYTYLFICSSSTAQGGGGSFKNRKPIGKVGCCESRMAERSHWWIERWLMSPLFLSLSLTIYLPTYLSIYLSTYVSIDLSTYLSINLSIHVSIYPSFYLPIYLSIHQSIYLSVYLSTCLSVVQCHSV